jgi:signal transduction histidine kinase
MLAILILLAAGLLFTQALYSGESGSLFEFDYRNGPVHEDLDAAYQNLATAPEGLEALETLDMTALQEAVPGYHFAVLDGSTLVASNISGLTDPEELYSHTVVARRYELAAGTSDTAVSSDQEGSLTIMLGMSRALYEEKNQAWQQTWMEDNASAVIRLAACLLVLIAGLIYLASVAGRRPDSEAIHFLPTDRLFTDVGLALWIGSQVLLIAAFLPSLRYAFDFWKTMTFPITAIFLVLSGLMAIYAWMVFWKRVKSRTLIRHSLTGWLFDKGIGTLIRSLKKGIQRLRSGPVERMPVLISIGFLAVNVFTILFGLGLSLWWGGFGFLVGAVVYLCGMALLPLYLVHQDQALMRIQQGLAALETGELNRSLPEEGSPRLRRIAGSVNGIAEGYQKAVETTLKSERLKTELITNVSHDLKTPLTSILNYVDLLKRAGLNAPEGPQYLEILDQKSQRLKTLTEDLFEAAKATTGNLSVKLEPLELREFLQQSTGEMKDRLRGANLDLRVTYPEAASPILVHADGRHLWRIMENLFLNVMNYAMPGSRVYLDLHQDPGKAVITLRNISATPLVDDADQLTERFVRGDAARTTSGSGLGLSIAKSLAELQKGSFHIQTDGDLFKAILTLPLMV